jgi:hypothetical protein
MQAVELETYDRFGSLLISSLVCAYKGAMVSV